MNVNGQLSIIYFVLKYLIGQLFSTEPGIGPCGPEGKKGSAGKFSDVIKRLFSA